MPDPLLIGGAINLGSTLFSGLKGPSINEQAANMILEFAKKGYPPEVISQMISKALGAVQRGVGQAQSSASSRLAAGGIDPTSGLAQERLDAIARAGLHKRGDIVKDIKANEFGQRLGAAQSLLGFQGGFNPLETLAATSGNALPYLALRGK